MEGLHKRGAPVCDDPTCRFVDATTFLELAISWNQLDRCDDTAAGVHVLRDRATGTMYLIREEELIQFILQGGLS